jgi:hypothetical protein
MYKKHKQRTKSGWGLLLVLVGGCGEAPQIPVDRIQLKATRRQRDKSQLKLRVRKLSHRNIGRALPRCSCQRRSSIRAEAEEYFPEPLGIGVKHSIGAHESSSLEEQVVGQENKRSAWFRSSSSAQARAQVKKKRSGARQEGPPVEPPPPPNS